MTWRQLCATVFAELLAPERRQVSLLGEKTPGNTRHLKWLMAQYPDRKVVALLREPVPTISGMLRRRGRNRHTRAWIDPPLRSCTRLYLEDMAAIAAAAQDAERVLVVRYEDLIRAPQPELERIAGFLGVPPFTPRPPLRADIFPRYVGEAIDPGRDGAARKRLNALQRGYVRYRCAEVLARFYAR